MEKTNNKKRVAIIVAIIALITAIAYLGTFTLARYISSLNVDTTKATVAKWGFQIEGDTSKMFGTSYTKGSGTTAVVVTANGVDVKASGSNNVVAPGTSGYITFSMGGGAEVLTKLTAKMGNIKDIVLKKKDASGDTYTDDYTPIKWALYSGSSNDSITTKVFEDKTLAEAKTEINKGIFGETESDGSITNNNDGTYTIIPGEELTPKYFKLSWAWPLNDTGTNSAEYSVKDTWLGYVANAAGTGDTYKNGSETVGLAFATTTADTVSTTTCTITVTGGSYAGVYSVVYSASDMIDLALTLSVEQIQKTGA